MNLPDDSSIICTDSLKIEDEMDLPRKGIKIKFGISTTAHIEKGEQKIK